MGRRESGLVIMCYMGRTYTYYHGSCVVDAYYYLIIRIGVQEVYKFDRVQVNMTIF